MMMMMMMMMTSYDYMMIMMLMMIFFFGDCNYGCFNHQLYYISMYQVSIFMLVSFVSIYHTYQFYQRPVPLGAQDIGTWLSIFQFLSAASGEI